MSDFIYLNIDVEGMRTLCGPHCPSNEYVSLGEYLKKKDPTPQHNKGYYSWTERDSITLGIDHKSLVNAWTIMQRRLNYCDANGSRPGCSNPYHSWFTDQKERIISIVEKRGPRLRRFNYSPEAIALLKKMGIQIVSNNKTTVLSGRDGQGILTIPFEQTDFVAIYTEEDKATGDPNICVLVSHLDGKQSYYVISSGKITYQQVRAEIVENPNAIIKEYEEY